VVNLYYVVVFSFGISSTQILGIEAQVVLPPLLPSPLPPLLLLTRRQTPTLHFRVIPLTAFSNTSPPASLPISILSITPNVPNTARSSRSPISTGRFVAKIVRSEGRPCSSPVLEEEGRA